MKILLTNDDGYRAQGLQVLVDLMRPYGDLTIVAPKYHQSGMSMAVSMGLKPIAVKQLTDNPKESWWYVDATPASCVKWALDEIFIDEAPDILISGINHGANTAAAALYSGTLGAAQEAALAGIPAIGVSLDNMSLNADFSPVKELFPQIFEKLRRIYSKKFGTYYNVNFPDLPAAQTKGVRICHQGIVRWEKEFVPFDERIFTRLGLSPLDMGIIGFPKVEPGEKVYYMAGDLTDSKRNIEPADHHQVANGFVTITAHNIDSTDYGEISRLRKLDFEV